MVCTRDLQSIPALKHAAVVLFVLLFVVLFVVFPVVFPAKGQYRA